MPWLIAAIIIGGLYLYGRAADAAAAGVPTLVPSPTGFMAVITDPNEIRQYQTLLASALAAKEPDGIGGVRMADYNAGDVDGRASNPRWISALSGVQRFIDISMAQDAATPGYTSTAPAGFPAQLRTDGVLDYATAVLLVNA